MTCCADDISFLGVLCQNSKTIKFKDQTWVEIEGVIHKQFIEQEQKEIPFITIKNYKLVDKIEDDLIYF